MGLSAGGQPAHRRVLEGLRHVTLQQLDREDTQHRPAVREGHIGTDPVAHSDPHAELLEALAGERLGVGFTGLDLAARELPAPGHLGRRGTLGCQHPAIDDDDCGDNHSR